MLKDQGLGLTLRNEKIKQLPERLKPYDQTGQIQLYPKKNGYSYNTYHYGYYK